LFGSMADETENQGPNIPKPDRTETRQEEAGSSWGWGACSDLYGSMADETENQGPNSQVLSLIHTSADLVGSMADKSERELSAAQGAGGMGPQHGQAPPEAAQGVQRSQSSQVLSLTHTSADLFGSMADETERERATAQGAGGMGPAHGQAPPEAAQHAVKEKEREMKIIEHAAFRAREDRFLYQASNCTGKKKRKKSGFLSLPRLATQQSRRWSQICVLRDEIRDQAVKEEQREMKSNAHAAQNSKVLSLTHTSADLYGSMAEETERELATAQGAGGMGPAHGQAPPKAAQGVQRTLNSQVVSLTHTSADLVGSMADETERALRDQVVKEEMRRHPAFRARRDHIRYLRDHIRDQAVKEEQREMKSNDHAAFSAIPDHAVKDEKKEMKSNDHAAFSAIRDHAVEEEKREMKSNDHAAFSAIRDHAVKEKKRDMQSNDHAAFSVSRDHAWKVGGPAWSGWGQAQICLAAWPTKLRTKSLIPPT
jgi:hypothetical protein